jgi:hypothetical protein
MHVAQFNQLVPLDSLVPDSGTAARGLMFHHSRSGASVVFEGTAS